MTDLERMLAVLGNSGDPAARLTLADALAKAGDEDAADRQRALAELLARHGSKFTTVTVAREWRPGKAPKREGDRPRSFFAIFYRDILRGLSPFAGPFAGSTGPVAGSTGPVLLCRKPGKVLTKHDVEADGQQH